MRKLTFRLLLLLTLFSCELSRTEAQTLCNVTQDLNFMIGEWDFFSTDGQFVGETTTRLVGGTCTIEEHFEDTNGLETHSVFRYDGVSGQWSQIWTDNFGTTLHFTGRFHNGQLEMKATSINNKNQKVYHRITYSKKKDGTYSQVWQTSTNQKEWKTIFSGKNKSKRMVL
jgi:hypothetical protein